MRSLHPACLLVLFLPSLALADERDRGLKALMGGKYDRAIRHFTAHLEADPADISTYYNRGLAFLLNRDYDRAIRDYTFVMRNHQLDPNASYNRGCAFLQKRDYPVAIGDFTAVIHKDPKHFHAYYNRAQALRALGHARAAEEDERRAARLELLLGN